LRYAGILGEILGGGGSELPVVPILFDELFPPLFVAPVVELEFCCEGVVGAELELCGEGVVGAEPELCGEGVVGAELEPCCEEVVGAEPELCCEEVETVLFKADVPLEDTADSDELVLLLEDRVLLLEAGELGLMSPSSIRASSSM